ncbi:MAG: hypothetical protein LUC40_07230, partial [Oscillospiraceae bacterium]|nr:hypothetical protein [Oscillospiraceae bacterium]
PNAAVYTDAEYLADTGDAIDILYPDLGDFSEQYNRYAYRNLDSELLDYINTLWETVKIN